MPDLSPANSKVVAAEVYLFACGHGDTILVGLPGPKWVLIDCCLPKHNGTYDRFLEFLDEKGVTRLDWVFLSHADEDHFLGMSGLLDHFTRDGRSLGRWLIGGLGPHDFRALAWPEERTKRRYRRLHEHVKRLSTQGLIRREFVSATSRATSPAGYQGLIEIFPIAPSAESILRSAEKALPALARDQTVPLEANALSVALVLALKEGDDQCNILFGGDCGVDELAAAVGLWQELAAEHDRRPSFQAVKVPHHGSLASHWEELPGQKFFGKGDRAAVISAGPRRAIPDREVLRAYLDNGWRVLATTRRLASEEGVDRPMTLANRTRTPPSTFVQCNVELRWKSPAGLTAGPPEAEVTSDDLPCYATARSATG